MAAHTGPQYRTNDGRRIPVGPNDRRETMTIFNLPRRVARARRAILGTALLLWAFPSGADTANFEAFVERTLVTGDSTHGGCMALLSQPIKEKLRGCWGGWVSFSCDGTFTDPVRAYRMLDQAQLALATGMRVLVVVDNTKVHNGYCVASRIDVLSN
jgi:hypothetical protein